MSLGNRAFIRPKDAKVSDLHMYVGGCSVFCRQRIDLLKQYDVLKFDVSMNYSAIVAVVKCRCKL